MTATLSQHLAASLAEKTRVAHARYRDLVELAGKGDETIDLDEASLIVDQAGKTAQDFDGDVSRCRTIRSLQTVIATEPDLNKRRAELDAARTKQIDTDKAERDATELRMRENAESYNRANMRLN